MVASSSGTASSSSSSSKYTGKWEYDVFLCFRGADTRDGFTSHLISALFNTQIRAFTDRDHQKTESLTELLTILEKSAISLVIFSEKFADSAWCLEEVATIAQSMEKFGHRVLPVFYKVSPSDVKDDSGSYAAAVDRSGYGVEDKKRWKDALKAVANCAGHTSRETKIESELIKVIVEDVHKRLIEMSSKVEFDNLVGMDTRVSSVEKLIAIDELDDTRIVGLWGMGGVGKTTLAKTCYQMLSSSTKAIKIKHHFLGNINDDYKKRGIEELVQELYSALLSEDNISVDSLDVGYRRQRLSRLRVFVVLDDVETPWQLEQLLLGNVINLTRLFALGSRIIITTRNKRVLDHAMAHTYHVECLNYDESLQLFSLHAFRKDSIFDDWMHLSRMALSYCRGSPLAIKVLGGALFRKTEDYWKSLLFDLKNISNPEIRDVLRRSYDALEVEEKQLFLDVACFLFGTSKMKLIKYIATSYRSAYSRVEDLIDKSLLICVPKDDSNRIQVHDLLKDLAWSIVNEESKLENRSRLQDPDDIHKLLAASRELKYPGWLNMFCSSCDVLLDYWLDIFKPRGGGEGRATETITLNLWKAKEMHLEANAFEGMDSLRFMEFFYGGRKIETPKLHLPNGGLKSLPDGLRWLQWDGFPSTSLPTTFVPENLTVLAMRHSHIQRCWKGVQPSLVSLIALDLSHCINLVDVPNLSMCRRSLELLRLKGCTALVEVPSHVQHLEMLIELDVGHCENLRCLPKTLDSKHLKIVRINKCPKVTICPKIDPGVVLGLLDLGGTPFKELPSIIYNVKQGGNIHLSGENITTFPQISTSLKKLRLSHTAMTEIEIVTDNNALFDRLELVSNYQLKSLSDSIWKMVKNELLIQDNPLIETLISNINHHHGLTQLDVESCPGVKTFQPDICNMITLQVLRFIRMPIMSLPDSINQLVNLRILNLSFCESLRSLPNTIGELAMLSILFMRGCSVIESLPPLPQKIKEIELGGCKSLQALPSNIRELGWSEFTLEDCPMLDRYMVDQVTADFCKQAMMSRYLKGILVCSGSELPKWCHMNYNEDGTYLEVELPAINSNQQMAIKGFAFGVALHVSTTVALYIKCDCNSSIGSCSTSTDTSFTFAGYGFKVYGDDEKVVGGSSDYVCLWFDKKLTGNRTSEGGIKVDRQEEEMVAWYMKNAGRVVSLQFYPYLKEGQDLKKLESIKIKSVGVSLLF
ncbi:Disease resistance-like protein DSC1 [Linum perenne]